MNSSREGDYLRASTTSLWVTPLSCALFLAIAWAVGRIATVPPFVYWLIIVILGITWLGDLINVALLYGRDRRSA